MFVNPVKAQGLLNTAEVSNIFSNITLILTINTELMNDLLKIKKSKPSTQNIGEIFLKLVRTSTQSLFPFSHQQHHLTSCSPPIQADYLKMYTQYCSNQGRALAEIENLKKTNPQFSTFLEAQPPRSPPTLSPFPKLIADPLDLAVVGANDHNNRNAKRTSAVTDKTSAASSSSPFNVSASIRCS